MIYHARQRSQARVILSAGYSDSFKKVHVNLSSLIIIGFKSTSLGLTKRDEKFFGIRRQLKSGAACKTSFLPVGWVRHCEEDTKELTNLNDWDAGFEVGEEISVSENKVSENKVSENKVSENKVSENKVSEIEFRYA